MYIFSVVIDKHITHNLLIEPFVKKKISNTLLFHMCDDSTDNNTGIINIQIIQSGEGGKTII